MKEGRTDRKKEIKRKTDRVKKGRNEEGGTEIDIIEMEEG